MMEEQTMKDWKEDFDKRLKESIDADFDFEITFKQKSK